MTIPDFSQLNVVVVGDVMLDRYWHGDVSHISPEAPVPVVKVMQCQDRAGGAANVALNVQALGAFATLIGVVGKDQQAELLQEQLQKAGVRCRFVVTGAATITKLRVISTHQQLIRLDFEETYHHHAKELLTLFKTELKSADAVIFSDYNKGTLANISSMIALACQAKLPVLVDPKHTDLSRYRHASVLTPNFKEFQAMVGVCHSEEEIVVRGEQLLQQYQIGALLITRSERGMTLVRANKPPLYVSTTAKEVFDVTGAGDTVIATLATSFAASNSLSFAVNLANVAAGIVVTKLGAATVRIEELQLAVQSKQAIGGVVTEKQLIIAVENARACGEKIVMTNGCFDILHFGHVNYLAQARRFGDRLIVAINDDLSVRRLKGQGRPINSLEKRMAVLASLSAVDWVVAFSQDTPQHLISRVCPDVLVKGGDYKNKTIAGSGDVIKHGGQVRTVDMVDGLSTTSLLTQIVNQHKRNML